MLIPRKVLGEYNVLGEYQILSLLGAGATGTVFRAVQLSGERAVAIKVLHPELARFPHYVQQFFEEAQLATSLKHPHIIQVFDHGTEGPHTYLVMRLLSGGNLAERIRLHKKVQRNLPSWREASVLLRQLADALDYVHSRNIVHGDLKPANDVFSARGNAYLTDFGLATLGDPSIAVDDRRGVSGTPAFMAPELWIGETATSLSDQYALAITIYLMIGGRLPFDAATEAGFMKMHLYETPISLECMAPDVSHAASNAVSRALAKDPVERFPTTTAFAEAFSQAIENSERNSFDPAARLPETAAVGTGWQTAIPI